MAGIKIQKAGIDRSHGQSIAQKWIFILGHLIIILTCIWIVYFNGWETIGFFFKEKWAFSDHNRAKILLACTILYWLRHVLTLFYLLQRKVGWSEVWGLLGFIAFFEVGLLLLGGGAFHNYSIPLNWVDLVSLMLLLVGSYLNSVSEIQRKWWKSDPANTGHCYTKGLFHYSTHINYFGDTVLFTGWCLFTCNYWTLSLPLFMGDMFVFFHMPSLDAYLGKRYGVEFYDYSARTKAFIPYLY
jgi:protein-S-isoprenylcysteine O-methyltransferase Ste14